MKYEDTVILVFAKAPVEGDVNTRLIPDIGIQAATSLQEKLIQQRLSILQKANLCDVVLMCAPDIQHECFTQCHRKYDVTLQQQIGKDLGIRMLNGVEKALQAYRYCIVIGTDAPALEVSQITSTIEILHGRSNNPKVVFVPAEDGGYVLIGLGKAYPFLFNNICWGENEVMQQSREALNKHHIQYIELEKSWDIDSYADYQRYMETINESV